jgi:prepilin-type N-terminal cleavage/methylation domain-containing protein
MNEKGFSLIEALIVVAIVAILAAIAFFAVGNMQQSYTMGEYAAQMNSMVQYAKMYAIQRTTNMGVCADTNNNFKIVNLGPGRGAAAIALCNATNMTCGSPAVPPCVVQQVTPTQAYMNIQSNTAGVVFDPRGMLLSGTADQNFCVDDGSNHYAIIVGTNGSTISANPLAGTGCP